jgi:hypothetical protein
MRVLAVLGQALRALTFSLRKFNFSNTLWSMDEVEADLAPFQLESSLEGFSRFRTKPFE